MPARAPKAKLPGLPTQHASLLILMLMPLMPSTLYQLHNFEQPKLEFPAARAPLR